MQVKVKVEVKKSPAWFFLYLYLYLYLYLLRALRLCGENRLKQHLFQFPLSNPTRAQAIAASAARSSSVKAACENTTMPSAPSSKAARTCSTSASVLNVERELPLPNPSHK